MTTTVPRRIGLYLSGVQFLFALTWVVYVIFLPALARQAGIAPQAVLYILLLDQLIFVVTDYVTGVASDKVAQVVGRLGRWVVAVTLLSCGAFMSLPWLAPQGSTVLFLAAVVAWSVSSSVLRAPPLTLVGRYAARPAQPALLALSLLGLGSANALAPYLGLVLRDVDPRWPFGLVSAALAVATAGIMAVERVLARTVRADDHALGVEPPPAVRLPPLVFMLAAAAAALALQVHVFVNSAPLYLRYAVPELLPWLAPVFWIGFNLGLWPGSAAVRRWGAQTVMGAGALGAAAAALLGPFAAGVVELALLQGLAGLAWAAVLTSAFALALQLGRGGRHGRFSGALSAVLAFAAVLRMSAIALHWHQEPAVRAWLDAAAGLLWFLAGLLLLLWAWHRRPYPPARRPV